MAKKEKEARKKKKQEKINSEHNSEEENFTNDDSLKVTKYLSQGFYGKIKHFEHSRASIEFTPGQDFITDEYGSIHSGILDSAGQFCALAAINHPNAIIIQVSTEFLSPVRRGMKLIYLAKSDYNNVAKRDVKVIAKYDGIVMHESTVTILVNDD